MSVENKEVIRNYYELLDQGNAEGISNILAEGISWDFPGQPDPLTKEIVIGMIQAFKNAFPDITHNIIDQWSDGECVFTLLNFRGTMQNELMGIPASGMKVDMNAQNIHWVSDGKIIKADTKFDNLQFMQDIGAMPKN